MQYFGQPLGMWALFSSSFQRELSSTLGYDAGTAKAITQKAKPKYREIIAEMPDFERGDRFQMNLVNAAMLASFVLNMPRRPEVGPLTDYYARAMMTEPMRWYCRKSGRKTFTAQHLAGLQSAAKLRAGDRNPYSWNLEVLPYPDGSGFEARFTQCGICALMRRLGLYDLTPALCHLDYTMTEAGETAEFVREYTLASGGPYCDCGYVKKGENDT